MYKVGTDYEGSYVFNKSLDKSIIPKLHDSQVCNTQSFTGQHVTEKISKWIPRHLQLIEMTLKTLSPQL